MKTQNTQELKELTLNMNVAKLLIAGQVKTQDDIIMVARFYMTDLAINFKEALEKVNTLIYKIQIAQDSLLN